MVVPRVHDGRFIDHCLATKLLGWSQGSDGLWYKDGRQQVVSGFTMFLSDVLKHIEPAMLARGYLMFIERVPGKRGRPAQWNVGWAHRDVVALVEECDDQHDFARVLSTLACKSLD